jgi:hypothetical protein
MSFVCESIVLASRVYKQQCLLTNGMLDSSLMRAFATEPENSTTSGKFVCVESIPLRVAIALNRRYVNKY